MLDRTRVRIVSILSRGPDFIKVSRKRNLGPDFRIFKSGSRPDFIYLVCFIHLLCPGPEQDIIEQSRYRVRIQILPTPLHGPAKFLVLDLVPTFPVCSRRIQRAFRVLPMVPVAYQCRLKFCHWQSLVTIGTNGMPVVTIGCHWVLPLVTNLADNLMGRQNYQRAK